MTCLPSYETKTKQNLNEGRNAHKLGRLFDLQAICLSAQVPELHQKLNLNTKLYFQTNFIRTSRFVQTASKNINAYWQC